MQVSFNRINFSGKPENYGVVDMFVSRSAQPQIEDFLWLKEQGVTDIINFRTMVKNEVEFNEEAEVKNIGMRYHSIPSITTKPSKKNIEKFLNIVDNIKKLNGKAHIHCKAGADRTGMYAFIYKMRSGLESLPANIAEWYLHGYHYKRYPDLMKWTINFVKNIK